ncbi:hypothetical protein D3C72_151110 [compost metagenome]
MESRRQRLKLMRTNLPMGNMKTIHLPLQGKGSAGKSLGALFAAYLLQSKTKKPQVKNKSQKGNK